MVSRDTRLRIVGTTPLPAIGVAGVTGHLSMGTGAEVEYHYILASVRNSFGNSPAGPNAVFIRFKPGVSMVSAEVGLARIANKLSLPTNFGVTLSGVQRPAEIVNYRSMGATPAILGLALAGGAVVALASRSSPRSGAVAARWRCSGRSGSPGASWPEA